MDRVTTVASRAGLVAFALFAVSCTESTAPERGRSIPSFSYSANGITLSRSVGTLNQSGQLLIKGFNPINPHRGDAIVATFFWLGSTFIIDSVYDVVTTNPYTPVGNKYTLVEYVQAGGYSMATYVATNVQNFPDASTDPGQILAVAAQLSQPISDGGLTLSAFTGVDDNFTLALGAHNSKSGTGSQPMFAHADPIAVNAGALAYTVTMSGLWGLDPPQGFSRIGPGSDNVIKNDAAYAVQSSAGTSDPQWGWFFGSSDTWLVTTMALNAAAPPGSSVGDLTATTSTSGSSLDPDGYVVTVDGGANQPIGVNGSVTFSGLAAGSHSVALSGLATDCTVSGTNPQTVSVPSGGTATAAFTVNCTQATPTTGDLTASTTSSGSSIPSSYTVTVDGSQSQPIASTGSVTFAGLTATDHTVVLAVPSNCTVTGGASRTVTVPAGGTATVSYAVSCVTPPGDLAVNTTSSGSSIPSSYTVTVDGSQSQTIASTGNVTFTGLSATNHTVVLAVSSNCTVSGGASLTVVVPSGGTATVSYTVSCVTPPGDLAVTTSSSGANIPASYTVTVDGSQSRTIASTGNVTFTNLAAGSHTAVLSVPANCTVSGGPSRMVTVPSGGTATVSYAVSCNAPPVVNAGPDETAVTGLLYTLRWSFTDANHNGPWTYTINWGDGTTSSGTVSSEGSFSTGHTYITLLPRSFTIRVTVRDAAGAAASDTKVVSVLLL